MIYMSLLSAKPLRKAGTFLKKCLTNGGVSYKIVYILKKFIYHRMMNHNRWSFSRTPVLPGTANSAVMSTPLTTVCSHSMWAYQSFFAF